MKKIVLLPLICLASAVGLADDFRGTHIHSTFTCREDSPGGKEYSGRWALKVLDPGNNPRIEMTLKFKTSGGAELDQIGGIPTGTFVAKLSQFDFLLPPYSAEELRAECADTAGKIETAEVAGKEVETCFRNDASYGAVPFQTRLFANSSALYEDYNVFLGLVRTRDAYFTDTLKCDWRVESVEFREKNYRPGIVPLLW